MANTALIVTASLGLAALAGAQLALLMLPCVRWARSAFAVLQPPMRMPAGDASELFGMPLHAPMRSRLVVRVAAAAPLAVLLLWARPFAGELLGIGATHRSVLQAGGLMLCGARHCHHRCRCSSTVVVQCSAAQTPSVFFTCAAFSAPC